MRKPKPPRLYFSLRSPFSWMAVKQLEERLPNAHEVLEYVPFFEPDEKSAAALAEQGGEWHYVAMSKAKHLYILQDTKRLAAKHRYDMRWPIDVDPLCWELPHLAWIKARHLGVHRPYYDAVMAARWERGEDICRVDVLTRVCEDAGLDAAALVAAADDDDIRAEGVSALMRIYSDDVFGVPYFTVGRQRFWGLDRLEDFLAALTAATGVEVAPASRTPEEHRMTGTLTAPATGAEQETRPLVDADRDPDPLEGVPAELIERAGALDVDTAGGCG